MEDNQLAFLAGVVISAKKKKEEENMGEILAERTV